LVMANVKMLVIIVNVVMTRKIANAPLIVIAHGLEMPNAKLSATTQNVGSTVVTALRSQNVPVMQLK
jgi:hypothetical protein